MSPKVSRPSSSAVMAPSSRRPVARGPPRGSAERLRDPDVVAERVADAEVQAVVLLRDLLRDLDALGLQLVVRLLRVVRQEEDGAAGCALRDEVTDRGGGLL